MLGGVGLYQRSTPHTSLLGLTQRIRGIAPPTQKQDTHQGSARNITTHTMTPSNKFNVGIIGYGLSAKVFQIPFVALTDSLVLHSIVQRSPSPGNSAPDDHPSVKHFTSIEPMLADPDVDVIIISTPPNTHFETARDALRNGKHVLVEKPFVPTSSQAEELAALAKEKKRVLAVYQNRRWDSDFLTVQKLLREGTLGRVVEFETHFDRFRLEKPTTWKGQLGMDQAGGVLYDLGTHLLDQVYVLFGMPSSVSAKFLNQREGKVVTGESDESQQPDSISAVLTYADSGLLVHVRISVVSVETKQPRFRIRGTKGSYHKAFLDPQEDQLRGGMAATDARFGKEDESRYGRLCYVTEDGKIEDKVYPTVEPETYTKIFEGFAKALETGNEEDIPVPASQAAKVLKIIEALRESAKTGRDVAP